MSITERFGHPFVIPLGTAPWQNGRKPWQKRQKRQEDMSSTHLSATTSVAAERQDRAKRRQIIEGARAVFLAQGFDAASMGEIARQARRSKATLHVHFGI